MGPKMFRRSTKSLPVPCVIALPCERTCARHEEGLNLGVNQFEKRIEVSTCHVYTYSHDDLPWEVVV